jgi:ATP-dependent Zn protease
MQFESSEGVCEYTRQELLDKMCVCFAGRAAERLVYGDDGLTTGASSDLQQARQVATAIFKDYGMDDAFMLGVGESETMKRLMDEKVNALLQEQYARTTKLLTKNRKLLDVITEALLKENSLTTKRINELLQTVEMKKEEQGE